MELILKYSGLIVIILAWICLIFPYLFSKDKYKLNTISDLSKKSKLAGLLRVGVILAGFFQVLFAYYLFRTIGNSLAGIGAVFFGFGAVSFLLAGLITLKNDPRTHSRLVKVYFTFMTLGTLMLSFSISELSIKWSLLAIATILVMVSGTVSFYFSKQFIKSEIWTIIFSNLWAIIVYITVLS